MDALLNDAAEDAGYDDDHFDETSISSPPTKSSSANIPGKQSTVADTLSLLRSSSDEIAVLDRQASLEVFEKASKQVKLDVAIATGDIKGVLDHASEIVNSDVEELARAGVLSKKGDEMVDPRRRDDDDDDDDNDPALSDEEEDEDTNPSLDRELFVSTYRGNARKVDKILNTSGSRCHAIDIHGWTALHWAASEGHDDIVELLLDHAKRKCSPSKFKKFLNLKDKLSGWTALHVASIKGSKLCVKTLLSAGAKRNIKSSPPFLEIPLDCVNAETVETRKAIVKMLTKH